MKTCPKCKLEKNRSEFYRDKYQKDGLCGWCKACIKKYNQTKNRKESLKKYRQSGKGKEVQRKYNQTEAGKETGRRKYIKRRKSFPEKIEAINCVNHALRDGRIFKKPCPCGAIKVEGHHEDYSKPLDVEWLCKKCHTELHRKELK